MKVTKWIDFSQEVEVDISREEIMSSLGGITSGISALNFMDVVIGIMRRIPESIIDAVVLTPRDIVSKALRDESQRWTIDANQIECNWHFDDMNGFWKSECGVNHLFPEDGKNGVTANGYRFCPYCGRKIKIIELLWKVST